MLYGKVYENTLMPALIGLALPRISNAGTLSIRGFIWMEDFCFKRRDQYNRGLSMGQFSLCFKLLLSCVLLLKQDGFWISKELTAG